MVQTSGVIICLGLILGLLFTAVPGGTFWFIALGVLGAIASRTRRLTLARQLPHPRIWLIAVILGLFASLYLHWRSPQPQAKDISKFVDTQNHSQAQELVIVRGRVETNPRITRSGRRQFILKLIQANQIITAEGSGGLPQGITGKLYVTVPILQATGIYPGQQVQISGLLYKPNKAMNPGSFDFPRFLEQEGVFAGLTGRQVRLLNDYKNRPWGWWQVRQRILQAQVAALGVPEGALVSAMVLGSTAVDLPHNIRDIFVETGLAHTLAASGFQVSLILGVILQLTQTASAKTRFILGALGLIIFLGLTGFQPSVMRALVMGFAVLLGLLFKRNVKPLGSLLLAATILLLINPLWIWDLGFQLSFLATFGLIVSINPIVQVLLWLPPVIASTIAIPLAATIWTLPLQLHIFKTLSIYSIPLNIISTPLTVVISVGGMISAMLALIWPTAGSTVATVLYYPTHWLIGLAEFFHNLPGNSWAVGGISTWQLLLIYTVLTLVWLIPWWQKRYWLAAIIMTTLVLLPLWHNSNLFKVTLLATNREPVIVIQDQGKVTLINTGTSGIARFTILPFLQYQGINQIHWAIASNVNPTQNMGWSEILRDIPIRSFYQNYLNSPQNQNKDTLIFQNIQQKIQEKNGKYQILVPGQPINTSGVIARLISPDLPILELQFPNQFTWLLVGNIKPMEIKRLLPSSASVGNPQVIWCYPESIKELIDIFQPQVAITTINIDQEMTKDITKNTKVFFTEETGALQWTPEWQFQALMNDI